MRSNLALSALMTLALAACAGSPARMALPGRAEVLARGQDLGLPDGGRLRYVQVMADSRCPPDVTCVRAGDADVAFLFSPPAGGRARSLTLNTAQTPMAVLDDWRLRLLALEFGPGARVTVRIDPAPRQAVPAQRSSASLNRDDLSRRPRAPMF